MHLYVWPLENESLNQTQLMKERWILMELMEDAKGRCWRWSVLLFCCVKSGWLIIHIWHSLSPGVIILQICFFCCFFLAGCCTDCFSLVPVMGRFPACWRASETTAPDVRYAQNHFTGLIYTCLTRTQVKGSVSTPSNFVSLFHTHPLEKE